MPLLRLVGVAPNPVRKRKPFRSARKGLGSALASRDRTRVNSSGRICCGRAGAFSSDERSPGVPSWSTSRHALAATAAFERAPDAPLGTELVDRSRTRQRPDAVETYPGPLETAFLQHPA